ncbi:p-loop nucleoside triphosphate hydrolase superfamily protein [Arachis hypogaea]|nr:p-loop nucleoside triphosphate hydrolase superfamily protein [Arachis hypogaea]
MVEIVTAVGIIKVGAAAAVPDCVKIDIVAVPVDAAATVLGCSRIITNEIRNKMGVVLFKLCDCDIEAQRAGCLLKKILQVIELHVSHQAKSIKNENNIFKAREEKYQSRINALETLTAGATEENKELRAAMKSVKNEVLKTKRSYSEDFKYFGAELSNGKVAETKVLER